MIPIGVAVIDANLLVPIVACDFLLSAFDHGLFEPIVSTSVLDEVERTLIDAFPRVGPGGLRRRVEHMRAALADQTIDATGFEGVVRMINAKDRHVVAAATQLSVRFPDMAAAWLARRDDVPKIESDPTGGPSQHSKP